MRDPNLAHDSCRAEVRDYIKVAASISLVTLAGWFAPLSYNALGYIYLLVVIALSLRISRWPALAAAVLSSVAWNFFFVPPRLSFSVLHFDESLLLITFFAVALIGSQLTALRSTADRAKLLAESERLHQTLLDSVSHELKTPVAVFRTAVEQLGTSDPGKRELLVAELRIATERLDNLVGNLLNQTRLESGVLRPKLDWCDGRDLVAAARRAVGSRLEDHPMTVNIPFDFHIFLADAALMEQAIAHLLLNAAVHTPSGTTVSVDVGSSDDAQNVFISVADNGPGVPAELRAKIFDKFSRGSGKKGGGLGLGLSIVRGFMVAQGGRVSVDSAPAGGARFTLFLPYTSHDHVPAG
jgi:two-component system sensor histidine kinase KdpD